MQPNRQSGTLRRRWMRRIWAALALAAFAAFTAQDGTAVPREAALVQFDYPPAPETFVVQLNDPALIATARAAITAGADDVHVMGVIIKEPADYNPPWSYHLDPDSISFFTSAVEVCDAAIVYVEANLAAVGDALLPGAVWCPWGSQLRKEVGPAPSLTPTPTPPAEPVHRLYAALISA